MKKLVGCTLVFLLVLASFFLFSCEDHSFSPLETICDIDPASCIPDSGQPEDNNSPSDEGKSEKEPADSGADSGMPQEDASAEPDQGSDQGSDGGQHIEEASDFGDPDSGTPDLGDQAQICTYGSVAGRVCATDQHTWVNGAVVSIIATDCNGWAVTVSATSGADGSFLVNGVPPGSWNVHAELGSFTQDIPVVVVADQTTNIPDNQLCVEQNEIRIAVLTGIGDKIENVLDRLSLTYTLYRADSTHYAAEAAPFLADLNQMIQYDLIFINCGAGRSGGNIDFGAQATQIKQNLHDYVAQGGSIYTSDWALLFANYAQPGMMDFLVHDGGAVTNPLATNNLMGYAPQTVTANVTDAQLATFLNKDEVSITFPNSKVACLHWGILQGVDPSVQIMVEAPSALPCSNASTSCHDPGTALNDVPMIVKFKLTPIGQKGGNVVYTSFHNIAQVGDDVDQILTYVVLHL